MRIKENSFEGSELYSSEILEEKRLLTEIKKESAELRNLFWKEEELSEKQEAVSFFDARMQAMVYYTLKNLEGYQQSGWKELIYEGEDSDGTTDSIQKNQS